MATQQNPAPATVPEPNNHQESRSTRIINRALYAMAIYSIIGLVTIALALPLERMPVLPNEANPATQTEDGEQPEAAAEDEEQPEAEDEDGEQLKAEAENKEQPDAKSEFPPVRHWINRGIAATLLTAALSLATLMIALRFPATWQSLTERPVHTTVNLLAALTEHPTGLPLRLIIQGATTAWDRWLHPVLNRLEPVMGDCIMPTLFPTRMRRERDEGRAEGRVEGRAEGRAEGEAIGRAEGRAEGEAIGRAEGRAEGEAIGRAEGRAEAFAELLDQMLREGTITPEQRAEKEAQYRANYPAQDSNHDRE